MRSRLQVATDSGLVILRDATIDAPAEREDEVRRLLRSGEQDGSWFFLDADDTVRYRIDLCVGEQPEGLPEHRFQRLGGSFLLRLPTGRLAVSGLEHWTTGRGVETVELEPGPYALSVRGPGDFDAPAYDEEMRSVVGETDWRYRTRVDRLALVGCLSTLLAAVLVIVPITRSLWLLAIALIAGGWLPSMVLQRLPRYRDIERRVRDHEHALPNYAIQLQATTPTESLVGGHLDVR